MATDEEEYYDSIDDTEFEECRSFCNEKFREDESEIEEDELNKINELVPFYTGDVEKSELDSLKNESKSNSITTLRDTKLKRRAPLTSLTNHRKNRSYLTMFYARNGQTKSGNIETSRATCSELSPKSTMSCEKEDRNSFYNNANSESLYNRFLEDNNGTYDTSSTVAKAAYKSESQNTLDSKLLSISEARFNSLSSDLKSQVSKRKSSTTKPLKICELGGLGPTFAPEKLQLLRRRQDYGKTVSEKNRIKMLESKVVRKLRHEIRECNKF